MEDTGVDEAWDFEAWKLVFGYYQQELTTYWVRSNFFLVVHGVLFAFVANVRSGSTVGASKDFDARLFIGCLLGFVLAVLWMLVLHSSYKWIEGWRRLLADSAKSTKSDVILKTGGMLSRNFQPGDETYVHARWRGVLRPAKVTQLAPVLFGAAWIALAIWVVR